MLHRQSLLVAAGLVSMSAAVGYYAHTARAGGIPSANTLTYSGTLQDENGAPIKGRIAIDFRLFDAREGGEERCVLLNPRNDYPLSADGRFSIVLPDACVNAVSEHQQLWVEIRVAGSELARTPLGAVPYAVEARRAATADSASGALEQRVAALEAHSGKVAGIWFANNASDPACAEMMNSDWDDVLNTGVAFTVEKPIRIWTSYAINVQPNDTSASEFVATRLVIDDVPSAGSGSHFQPFTSANPNTALTGTDAVDLEPGSHTVKLQWRTGGGATRIWANCGGWDDGFQGGRSLTVIGVYR